MRSNDMELFFKGYDKKLSGIADLKSCYLLIAIAKGQPKVSFIQRM